MEVGLTELLALVALLLAAAYVYFTWHFNVWKEMGVPGPKPWPIIGNMMDLLLKPMWLLDVEQLKKYGKVIGIFEGRRPALIVSDFEMLKHIYIKDFDHFIDRRSLDLSKIDPSFNHMLITLEGEKWRTARNILSPAFTSGKLKAMTLLIAKAADNLASVLKKNAEDDTKFEVKEASGGFMVDVIASCGFGVEVNSLENPNDPFVIYSQKINTINNFWIVIAGFFPFLMKYFRLPIIDAGAVEFFKKAAIAMVEERKKTKVRRADFLQLMIEAEEPEEGNTANTPDPVTGKPRQKFLTNDMIVGQSILFFLAGFESVTTTMAYVAYLLALNPECQEILVKEVDEAIEKHGDLTYDAVASMSYLDMVMSETIRLYPAGFRLERKCVQDYKYENITIKAGTIVVTPVYAIHHNEENFPDPEEFRPERFSNQNKGKIHSMAYLPFGLGPRNCIGMRFALLATKVGLVQILRRVTFVTCPEIEVPLKFKPRSPRFYPGNGIYLKAQKRH